MGLLWNTTNEIDDKVREIFGDAENYLLVNKHNGVVKGLAQLLLSRVYYIWDNTRQYILYFNAKGISEKDTSGTLKGQFLLMPWHEIEDLAVEYKRNRAILTFTHLGKKLAYEIPFTGPIYKGNDTRLERLESIRWNRI